MAFAVSGVCGEPKPASSEALFKKLDVNGDGEISLKEFQGAQAVSPKPHKADKKQPAKNPPVKKQPEKKQPAKKQAAKKQAVKKQAGKKPECAECQSQAARKMKGRSPKRVSFDTPYLQHQVVDVDEEGQIFVRCSTDLDPVPEDCPYDGDGDGEPDAFETRISMFAKIYTSTQPLPMPGSCPPPDATPLDTAGYEGWVSGAPSSSTYPLPRMTLVVWEVVEYLDVNGETIDQCTECPPYNFLFLYGHYPLQSSR
ncbi:MAG: EF-hand domain-containing protein [Pirellulaceae bacterium]